jgi:murein DD-endopeptidase MepM/ murein hydrolase activator NlpD
VSASDPVPTQGHSGKARARASARARRRPLLHGLILGLISLGVCSSVFVSQAFPFSDDDSSAISGLSIPSIGGGRAEQAVLTSDVLTTTVRREELEQGLQALAGVTPTGEAAVTAAGAAAAAPVDPYALYTVREGDTASAIAARNGIDLQYLLWANSDLRDGEFLVVGQTLIIPSGNGILHHVRYGETLSDVAARYGVSVDTILAWVGNGITSADNVLEDQTVFVPGGVQPSPVAQPTAAPTDAPVAVVSDPAPAAPVPASASSTGLIWPVAGPISSYMDASHPLGIDIDLYNNPNGAIVAATSGTVTFAGGDPCCSYGLYVVIVSPDGIETLYAHLSSISVSAGQTVNQGDVLGYAGCTGYCTGNHLHFEVIDNGVRVDPLAYLP